MTTNVRLSAEALAQLFHEARTHNGWRDKEVPDALLREAVDIAKWGPTSANCSPMRIVFVRSAEAKARLAPAMAPGNLEKTLAAPATAIVAYDVRVLRADCRAFFPQPTHGRGSLEMRR